MYMPGVTLSRQHHLHKVHVQRVGVEYNKEKGEGSWAALSPRRSCGRNRKGYTPIRYKGGARTRYNFGRIKWR